MATQSNNLFQRTASLRAQATAADLAGLSVMINGQNIPSIAFNTLLREGIIQGGGASADDFQNSRWGIFLNGSMSFGSKEDSQEEPGFDFETQGITLGVDYRLKDNMVIGIAAGLRQNDSDLGDNGLVDVQGNSLSLYGTLYSADLYYFDALVSFGQNQYDTERVLKFESVDQTAISDTSGSEIAISVGGGLDYAKGGLSFGPYTRIDWTQATIEAYQEQADKPSAAGKGLMLSVKEQDVNSLSLSLGGQISYTISTDSAVYIPQLRLDMEHQFSDRSRDIEASFLSAPTETIIVKTDSPDRDYINLGLSVSATMSNGKSAFIQFETLLGFDNLTQSSVTLGGRWEF